jgi:phosphoribosylformylglycinamidine synthase
VLAFPVVSGNVSLYNETNGRAILPTPSIGGVGVLDDFKKSATIAFKGKGDAIMVIGETTGWLGQSIYLRELCGMETGAPPPVDLAVERRNGDFVRALIAEGFVSAVHDVSDGGLLVTIAEMAMASGIGAELEAAPIPAHGFWFGEDQARYVLGVSAGKAAKVATRARGAGIPIRWLGTTGGDTLTLAGERPIVVAKLSESFEGWLPAYMGGAA